MWVTQSALSSPMDFFLLSLTSKYYSVARVGRHHQEQEVKKASRAAVFLPGPDPPISSHDLSYHAQLCLMLPFSAYLMIL